MKRYYIVMQGVVQGVGFRAFCHMQALKNNLTGSVRNMSNGMVSLYIQGKQIDINNFLKIIKEGNVFINVTDYTIKELPVITSETSFIIDF